MSETAQASSRASAAPSNAVKTYAAKAYAAQSASSGLAPFGIKRREVQPQDVQIEILFCGVCHSDLHLVRNEWVETMPAVYPVVPGHEIVGRVVKTGSAVKKFKEGDLAGVGCMVDSCRVCPSCREGEEQYCDHFPTLTYNSPDKHLGRLTYGGYSQSIVVDESFTLRVPSKLDLAATAPLLCAGITTYSPLRQWNVRKGQKVGVAGLGGLGHMGIKLAKAFGARVVLFTGSENKSADALRLGADEVVISKNAAAMQKHAGTFDLILDTIPAPHDLNAYLNLLRLDGTLAMVGAPSAPLPVATSGLNFRRRKISGSIIGGIRATQEMLDFCGEHGIAAEIELIRIDQINEAYDRLQRGDVKYRFVIDIASLR